MNVENERERRVEEVIIVHQEVAKISKAEVRRALKRIKSRKAIAPDICGGLEVSTRGSSRVFN